MDSTPDSAVQLHRCKEPHYYGISDSGYSDLILSTERAGQTKYVPRGLSSSDHFNEIPKENLPMSVTPKKERSKETVRFLDQSRRAQQPSGVGLCETPKVSKKDALLRRKLLMCHPESAKDVKTDDERTSNTKATESNSKSCFGGSYDSPDSITFGAFASSTLKTELEVAFSGRKRRLFFSQVKTSTFKDGGNASGDLSSFVRKISLSDADLNESVISSGHLAAEHLETPHLDTFLSALARENSNTPGSSVTCESPDALCTPPSTCVPKYTRSVSEDSGIGSLALEKSQDSLSEHDGSFQELLPFSSAPRSRCETPHLAEAKRRTRLQRQQRLSTLREGGSQSEEDIRNIGRVRADVNLMGVKNKCVLQCQSLSKEDEVFLISNVTPSRQSVTKLSSRAMPLGITSAKIDNATPFCTPTAKQATVTPLGKAPASQSITPLRTTPVSLENLSMTPALQLVHAMCQQKTRMSVDQSPCLEEQLRSIAALAETPLAFRTTMPLAGLIGRKMGLGKVDVLTELKKRNLRHILAVIFNHLSQEDVYRFGQVCTSWNEIILQDKQASCRRRLHPSELEASLELGASGHVPDAETRLTLVERPVLRSVQSQSHSKSFGYCTPQSGKSNCTPSQLKKSHSSSSKRDKFLQVAKTLFNDECLKPCPRCEHPARCHPIKKEGLCSRADCAFQFCTACLCAFHESRECASRSADRRSKRDVLLPGSVQSKRNLRRL